MRRREIFTRLNWHHCRRLENIEWLWMLGPCTAYRHIECLCAIPATKLVNAFARHKRTFMDTFGSSTPKRIIHNIIWCGVASRYYKMFYFSLWYTRHDAVVLSHGSGFRTRRVYIAYAIPSMCCWHQIVRIISRKKACDSGAPQQRAVSGIRRRRCFLKGTAETEWQDTRGKGEKLCVFIFLFCSAILQLNTAAASRKQPSI